MEALIIINLALSAVLLLCVGYLIFARRAGSDAGEVRRELRQGAQDISTLVSSSVSASNTALIQSVKDQIEVLERRLDAMRNALEENRASVVNAINENFKGVIESSGKSNEALILQLSAGLDTIRKQNNEKLDLIQKAVDEFFSGKAEKGEDVSEMTEWGNIKDIKSVLGKKGLVAVAGGIKPTNVEEAIEKGANIIIAGRYIIGSRDVRRAAQDFLEHFDPDPDNMRLAMDEDENIEVKD